MCADELKLVLDSLGYAYTIYECEDWINKYDETGEAVLDYEEFTDCMIEILCEGARERKLIET